MNVKKILKYGLDMADRQVVPLPPRAAILSVGNQNEQLVMWVSVPVRETVLDEDRTIVTRGTGRALDEAVPMTFIGTVLTLGGRLAWHVFEEHDKEWDGTTWA